MKKYLALILALALCLGLFAGCGKTAETETPTEPDAPKVEDDGILRILILGHSLGVDSAYLLPAIMESEGVTDFEIGLVYGSYPSGEQRKWFTTGARKYCYREYTWGQDTTWRRADHNGNFTLSIPGEPNDTLIADGTIDQPMEFGIERRDWDIVVIMPGGSEQVGLVPASDRNYFEPDNFRAWKEFVLAHDIEKATTPKFAYHMVWTTPNDPTLVKDGSREFDELYFPGSEAPDYDRYTAGMSAVQELIVPMNFDYILPTGTAIQNAKSSAITGRELYRDYIHLKDYGRLIAGYTWFCKLTGKNIRDCKIGPFHYEDMLDQAIRMLKQPVELTQQQKDILVESVENAINNPFQMTPSQYTK